MKDGGRGNGGYSYTHTTQAEYDRYISNIYWNCLREYEDGPNAWKVNCRCCGEEVWLVRNSITGGFFLTKELGAPWELHPCWNFYRNATRKQRISHMQNIVDKIVLNKHGKMKKPKNNQINNTRLKSVKTPELIYLPKGEPKKITKTSKKPKKVQEIATTLKRKCEGHHIIRCSIDRVIDIEVDNIFVKCIGRKKYEGLEFIAVIPDTEWEKSKRNKSVVLKGKYTIEWGLRYSTIEFLKVKTLIDIKRKNL